MKLLFKQRFFTLLDSFDIFDEDGNTLYTVKSEFDIVHNLHVYDAQGYEVGGVKRVMFTLLPEFEMYAYDDCVGTLKKEFSPFKPTYHLDINNWQIVGDWTGWDYRIANRFGRTIATISKKLFQFVDTYIIDVDDEEDPLYALLVVLAIDAEKCARSKN